MENSGEQTRKRLIEKMLQASEEISKKGRHGTASFVMLGPEIIADYAWKKGMFPDEAEQHLRDYFMGKHNNF